MTTTTPATSHIRYAVQSILIISPKLMNGVNIIRYKLDRVEYGDDIGVSF